MSEGKSNATGDFFLSGTETEFTTIDPKLNIYHKCNWEGVSLPSSLTSLQPCLQKFSIGIPDEFVFEGKTPKKVFDMGEMNLNGDFSGQFIDCLN